MTRRLAVAALFLSLGTAAGAAWAQTVVGSKHDLTLTGPGPIRSPTETQVCVFCHISHGQGAGDNRPLSPTTYQPYRSSTLVADVPTSPTGTSRVCLSCHDGTIAVGRTVASGLIPTSGFSAAPIGTDRPSNLGTDLRRSHPVSFAPHPGPRIVAPTHPRVRLDALGAVQCTTCHDPHVEFPDGARGKFLIDSNRNSTLCLACHTVRGWNSSAAHQSSNTSTRPIASRAQYPFDTVAENGCESCHRSHNATPANRLVRASVRGGRSSDALCLDCHSGAVARTNLDPVLRQPFAHWQGGEAPTAHDAAEGPDHPAVPVPERRGATPRHVTCVDCHDPHASASRPSDGVRTGGALAGVWGISIQGQRVDPAQFEYEICFKCHGDSANRGAGLGGARSRAPQRSVPGVANLRLAFAADAASAHPVAVPGKNPDVPSLKPPWSTGSLITCTDCHNSDTGPRVGGSGPNGPHGSSYEFLLEREYSTRDRTPEAPLTYALCYKCHERDVLLSDMSAFPLHRKHVVDSTTPCSACHTPHGIGSQDGNLFGNSRLMDFDTFVVGPGPRGQREFRSLGRRAGTCSVSCHGVVHDDTRY